MDWLYWNHLATEYDKLIGAINVLMGLLISLGLFFVGWKANSIAKSNLELARQEKETRQYRLSEDERKIFREVYVMISEAIGLVLREGSVGEKANSLFWQARDRARLELPEKIAVFAETLREASSRAYSINESYLYPKNRAGLSVGEERSRKVDEHEKYISILTDAKPYESFAPYMRSPRLVC